MLNKVISAIDKYGMLDGADNVTVALSGGADSVCLLLALHELRDRYRISLSAIHVNHMLRGEESFRDERFVKALCEKMSVPLVIKRVDVKQIADESSESIELAARKVRYQLFREEARGVVATAHSADDNLETVLYNMTRGTGIKGLCGIPPKRDVFVRPLIFCSRREIEEYLAGKETDFVTDSTNLTDDYTRNFLRHNAVPLLRQINPSVTDTVSVMCKNLREDNDFLQTTARKIYTLCAKGEVLDAELLRVQHPAVIKRAIAFFLEEEYGITTDALHLENCKDVLLKGGRTDIKANVSVLCDGRQLRVLMGAEPPKPEFIVETKEISVKKEQKINNLFLKNAIDCGKINGSLVIRERRPSDGIRLRGRNCTKSLKKLFNELKIPPELRDCLPVAADDEGIVWIHGVGVSERVAVGSDTVKAIEFIVTNINKS